MGEILAVALTPDYEARAAELAERVAAIVERYPLYEGLAAAAAAAACAAQALRDARDPGACDAVRTAMAHPNELDALYAFLVAAAVTALSDAAHDAPRAAVGAIDEPRERGLSERPDAAAGRPGDLRRRARRRR